MKIVDHNPGSGEPLKRAVGACVHALVGALTAEGLPHVVFAVVAVNADAENPARDMQVASNLEPDKAVELFRALVELGTPRSAPMTAADLGKGH